MPTQIETFSGVSLEPITNPEEAKTEAIVLGASLTLARGTVLGKRTSNNKHYAYNDSLTDGTETATCILKHDVKTDASGNVYYGDSAVPSAVNLPHATAVAYIAGTFNTSELTGYNAAALADFQGRLTSTGYLRIG